MLLTEKNYWFENIPPPPPNVFPKGDTKASLPKYTVFSYKGFIHYRTYFIMSYKL
jgi:hypothetical protein